MNSEKNIIRLLSEGPKGVGLSKMSLDASDFQSELPEQNVHIYFEDPKLGLTVGVWTTTTMQESFGPYPGDEVVVILEGQAEMVDAKGHITSIGHEATACIQNGIPISWKQTGFLRKFFITYDNPNKIGSDKNTAINGVTVLKPEELEPKLEVLKGTAPFVISGHKPIQRDNCIYTNDQSNFMVGMWDSEKFESDMEPFPCHEFVHLLDGSLTITQENGTVHEFKQGDVFFVPEGTICSWKANTHIKKFYAIFDANVSK